MGGYPPSKLRLQGPRVPAPAWSRARGEQAARNLGARRSYGQQGTGLFKSSLDGGGDGDWRCTRWVLLNRFLGIVALPGALPFLFQKWKPTQCHHVQYLLTSRSNRTLPYPPRLSAGSAGMTWMISPARWQKRLPQAAGGGGIWVHKNAPKIMNFVKTFPFFMLAAGSAQLQRWGPFFWNQLRRSRVSAFQSQGLRISAKSIRYE